MATAIPVLWGVTFLTFLVINRLPGDAAQQLLGINATQQQIQQLRSKLNLDQSFITRYFDWLGDVLSGNLGRSFASDQTVTSILNERLPVTFELLAYALIVSLLFTVPVALLAARRPNGIVDRLTMATSMAGLSVANYVLALLLVYVFAVKLEWLPAIGYVNPADSFTGWLKTMTLPAFALSLPVAAQLTRIVRTAVVEELDKDYVRTAIGSGLPPVVVVGRNVLRNALMNPLTVLGLRVGYLLGGAVVIETIFSLPGMGKLMIDAVKNGDPAVVQGVVLTTAAGFVVVNLVIDVLYLLVNPRLRDATT